MLSGLGVLRRASILAPASALESATARKKIKRKFVQGSFEIIPKEWLWSDEPERLEKDEATGWTQESVRTGVLAQKLGMVHTWDKWYRFQPLTVLEVPSCVVTKVKTVEEQGVSSVQVAAGKIKPKNVKKPQLGEFQKAGVEPRRKLADFPITPEAAVPVGTELLVSHFKPGQLLDIQGVTKGKGFQGVMKRWNFAGGRASHGTSKAHRQMGSTGACQDPGKVWKGKKMPGRMGGDTRTVKNVQLYAINTKKNYLYVKGSIPGGQFGWLRVIDAKNKKLEQAPHFPTFVPKEGEELAEEIIMEMPDKQYLGDDIVDLEKEHREKVAAATIHYAERAEKEEKDRQRKKLDARAKRAKKRVGRAGYDELDDVHMQDIGDTSVKKK